MMLPFRRAELLESMATPTAFLNLSDLLKDIPAGAWVAISHSRDRVVSYGADMREVLQEARKQGEAEPYIVRVPEQQGALLL